MTRTKVLLPLELFRCIFINGDQHKCRNSTIKEYHGSGDTTVGTWWRRPDDKNNLALDHLIIASGIVQYNRKSDEEKQLCYAKVVERNLP